MKKFHVLTEDHYYDRILQSFSDRSRDNRQKEIWKNKNIIGLMQNLGEAREGKKLESFGPIVTNSLILTLALFDDIPPNCFNRKGQDFKDLSQEERNELKSILQKII